MLKARVDISFKCVNCAAQNNVKVNLFDLLQMWKGQTMIYFYCIQCGKEHHLKNEEI